MTSDKDSIHNPVLVALDVPNTASALNLAQQLRPFVGGFKVGLELFCTAGPAIIEGLGPDTVFLDLKFHDIPNTVAGAVRATARLEVMMLTVHCLGGTEMMRAAVTAGREVNSGTKIIGVTILTSHDAAQLQALGMEHEPASAVRRLALLAREAGLDGVVCSPQEIKAVQAECGADFLLVTPGIRPQGYAADDQKRVLTPQEAVAQGADWLVVGRPITGAPDPIRAAQNFLG